MSGKNVFEYREDHVVMILKKRNGEVFEVLIDENSVDKVSSYPYKWSVRYLPSNKSYYVAATVYLGINEKGKPSYGTVYLHRFLTGANNNEYNHVDHINHNPLDNRLENLRVLSTDKNLINRKDKNSNNTTGYRNVTFEKNTGKYVVQLQINGKNKTMGRFKDVHEAGEFAEKCREKYYTINITK